MGLETASSKLPDNGDGPVVLVYQLIFGLGDSGGLAYQMVWI